MKIELANVNKVAISELKVGETFTSIRKNEKTEIGVYMKVDRNSGVFVKTQNLNFAVNLESGQVRKFYSSDLVTPISIKVVADN